MKQLACIVTLCALICACAPEVGSKPWCQAMKEKDKGDWTATEAKDYAKHCIFN